MICTRLSREDLKLLGKSLLDVALGAGRSVGDSKREGHLLEFSSGGTHLSDTAA